jgi:hypothetical protein
MTPIEEKAERTQCPDCIHCQMCSKTRCRQCRKTDCTPTNPTLGPFLTHGQYLAWKEKAGTEPGPDKR